MTQGDVFLIDLEEIDRPLIDHVIPSTLLRAAVALNDMIYISCERMECKEHDVYDGFDNLSLKNSLDATEVTLADYTEYTDYSNDHSSRDKTKDSSPDPRTNYSSADKINRSSKDGYLNSQHKDKSKCKDETIYRQRMPLCSIPVPSVSSQKPRIEGKKQLEIHEEKSSKCNDRQVQKQDTRTILAALAYEDSQLVTSQKKTEQSSKKMKTKIFRSLNTNSQHPEKSRPSGNSIRHFKRSLSKYIRPAKGENTDLSSDLDKKDPPHVVVDQHKPAQNIYSGRTFRPKFLYTNNESTRNTDNSGRTSQSAIFDQPVVPVIMKREYCSTRSHRTSNLDLNNNTEENNHTDQQEEEPTKKKVEENEVSGRSFRTTFLSRGRSKSCSQHKRTSLMSRLRGRERSPSKRKPRDKKYASTEMGTITEKIHHKEEEEQGNAIHIPSVGSNNISISDDDGRENGNINNKYESIQSQQDNNGAVSTRKYTETKTEESYVFLASNNNMHGQDELAPPDGNYYYDDPGQVHSLLTMPTFGTLAATTYNNDRPIKEIQFQKEITGRNDYKYE
jgi:hypothetical protein